MSRSRLVLSLLLVTLLAGILRLFKLGELPPGFWFDEGWVTLAALNGGADIYFEASFGGMHPVIVYLTRLTQQFSSSPRVIRWAVAWVGILSVPLSFFAYQAIFHIDQADRAETKALLAALLLAILYPFVHFSRLGFESMLPLPAALLAFWLLALPFTWWRTVLLGVVLGLSIYTFDTGRFVPIAAAAAFWFALAPNAGAAAVTNSNRKFVVLLFRFAVIVIVALITGAPLLNFFVQNWDQFLYRASLTTIDTLGPGAESVPLAILGNLGRTLAGVSWPGFGDRILRHNLPGRPMLDPFISIFFWLGLASILRDGLSPERRTRSGDVLFWWLAAGLLPIILTDGAPTYTRLFVAAPAIPPIAAAGAIQLLTWGNARWHYAGSLAVGLLLLFGFNRTLSDYFNRWAKDPALYEAFQVAQWEIALFGQNQPAGRQTYFIPLTLYAAEPTFNLLPPGQSALPLPPCLVFPPPDRPALLMADEQLASDALLPYQAAYPDLQIDTPLRHPLDGRALLRTLAVPARAEPALTGQPIDNQFGAVIRLDRFQWDGRMLTLVWEAAAPPEEPYSFFVHLYQAGETETTPLVQSDQSPCYPTQLWRTGERIVDAVPLTLPDGASTADVTLAVGWYHTYALDRLPLQSDSANRLPDNRLILPVTDN